MSKVIFIRHFKTKIEKDKPVSDWDLDDSAKQLMQKMLDETDFSNVKLILTSPEFKAHVTAKEISKRYNIDLVVNEKLREVDRSKSGFIEGDYTKVVEDYFKSRKDFGYEWEKFADVKTRIKTFINDIPDIEKDIIVVSHGMILSVMLARYFDENTISFWKKLGFGDIIETDFEKLKQIFN